MSQPVSQSVNQFVSHSFEFATGHGKYLLSNKFVKYLIRQCMDLTIQSSKARRITDQLTATQATLSLIDAEENETWSCIAFISDFFFKFFYFYIAKTKLYFTENKEHTLGFN